MKLIKESRKLDSVYKNESQGQENNQNTICNLHKTRPHT